MLYFKSMPESGQQPTSALQFFRASQTVSQIWVKIKHSSYPSQASQMRRAQGILVSLNTKGCNRQTDRMNAELCTSQLYN